METGVVTPHSDDRSIQSFVVWMASISLLCACGGGTKFALSPESLGFGQQVTYNNKVDVLWVVDTSQTMAKEQNNLSLQFGSFIDVLDQKGIDYKMAITTMDMSGGGERGAFVGQPKVLSRNTPNVKNLFSANIKLGEQGSDLERGMDAMRAALSAPLLNGANAGFMREDAVLAIVFISNEDDKSGSTQTFINFLNTVKPDFPFGAKGWIANVIGVLDPRGTCTTKTGYVEPADKYMELVNYSGGSSGSICSNDLSNALSNIRQRISEMITAYRLGREPDVDSIRVMINGVLVPKDPVNGWTYDPNGFVIRFHGNAVPAAGADVRIDFQPKTSK